MALSVYKTFVSGETLTAADLNSSLTNIHNNALSLISPLTGNLNANLKQITNMLFETQAANQTAATEGRVYYQTTEDQIHVDDGTAIRRVPTIASVARGDTIVASAASQWARLALGAAGKILRSDGTDLVYSTATYPTTATTGDLVAATGTNALGSIAAVATGQLLTSAGVGTIPAWSAAATLNTSLQIGVASTSTGSLKLGHASSANLTTIQAGNASAAVTYVWPTAGGSANQVLTTDGGGAGTQALSWASAGVTGSGAATRVSYWSSASALTSSANLTTDGSVLTLAAAGPSLQLTNADSQIFLGGTTDPGWTTSAIQMFQGDGGVIYSRASVGRTIVNIASNEYFDGSSRYIASQPALRLSFDNTATAGFSIQYAAAGTAGAVISYTTAMAIGDATAPGVIIGSPTGGQKGAGALNVAADVYKNNTAYTNPDWLLEWWARGSVKEYADRLAEFRTETGLPVEKLLSLEETEEFARENLHLPLVSRDPSGAFARSDMALALVEDLYRHLFELNSRIALLETELEKCRAS